MRHTALDANGQTSWMYWNYGTTAIGMQDLTAAIDLVKAEHKKLLNVDRKVSIIGASLGANSMLQRLSIDPDWSKERVRSAIALVPALLPDIPEFIGLGAMSLDQLESTLNAVMGAGVYSLYGPEFKVETDKVC